jgi:hypothetical protein
MNIRGGTVFVQPVAWQRWLAIGAPVRLGVRGRRWSAAAVPVALVVEEPV